MSKHPALQILSRCIIGGILPAIYWATMPCHRNGEPVFFGDFGFELESAPFEADFLCIEWLWHGATVYVGEVRDRSAEKEPSQ